MRRTVWGAGLAFAMGVLLIAAGSRLERGVPEWVLVVPLGVACAGVLVRRRAPVVCLGLGVVAVGLDAVVGPSLGTVLVFTDNLYAAALYGSARLARGLLMVTAVLAIGAGAGAGFWAADWRLPAVIGVQASLVLVTPVLTALLIREQRDRAAVERVRAEQVARLAELDRRAAIAAERTRMARELHDLIANHFSAIAIQSTAALSRTDLDAGTVRKIMESVRENSVEGLAEMRTIIGLLREEDALPGSGDEERPGGEAVRLRLAEVEVLVERVVAAGMAGSLRVEGTVREVPAAVDLAGYRIVQEALTNALKHGESPVEVVVSYEVGRVVLRVWNAVGGERRALPGAGAGLVGMRERAALVGGSFEAGPSPAGPFEAGPSEAGPSEAGPGWEVVAVLPTEERSPAAAEGMSGLSSQVVGLVFPRGAAS
ncbi:sensor histidine kinase [Nonomuraea bangladeshensis]|uniref:sensor histidine kinase n=1 Tax=Nonomuraea bangladeshensis TaxID=404385 RepID=UPI003C2FF670